MHIFSDMKLMRKFRKNDLQSLICFPGCSAASLFFMSLPVSHTLKLKADITALSQSSFCPPSSSQSASTLITLNLTARSPSQTHLFNPPPPHLHLTQVTQCPIKASIFICNGPSESNSLVEFWISINYINFLQMISLYWNACHPVSAGMLQIVVNKINGWSFKPFLFTLSFRPSLIQNFNSSQTSAGKPWTVQALICP